MTHKNLIKQDIAMILELMSEGCTLTEISYYAYGKDYFYLRDQLVRNDAWIGRPRPNNSARATKTELKEKRKMFIQSLNYSMYGGEK